METETDVALASSKETKSHRAEINPVRNELPYPMAIWIRERAVNDKSAASYSKTLRKICTFDTIEGFWACHSRFLRLRDTREKISDYHIFREGIAPLWEDEANSQGGRWVAKFKMALADSVWETALMAMVGDSFDCGDEICGIMISMKSNSFDFNAADVLSVWTKNSKDKDILSKIKYGIRQTFGIPADRNVLIFKPTVSVPKL